MNDKVATGTSSRLFFIDHLRAFLVILVVVHHVALVYGGTAPFYYMEPTSDPFTLVALLIFMLVNQSWFMGAFFLLAGYFTPGSFDRKRSASFLKDRLIRLGVPLILFFFVLNPVSSIGTYKMPAHVSGINTPLSWEVYPQLLGMGPMWFVALLLIFTFGYAGWRMLTKNRELKPEKEPFQLTFIKLGLFILVLAVVSFFLRKELPLGQAILGFPTLAYFPQYLSFYILGIVAYHNNWFRYLPGSMGMVGLVTALAAAVVLFPLAFSGRWFSLSLTPALTNAMGYGQWQSAVYALWDSIFAVGMTLAAITLFRGCCNREGKCGRFMAQHSFAVYVIHIPVLVFIALAIRGIDLVPMAKFTLATVLAVPTSFAAAYVMRKLPLFSKIF